MLPVTSFLPSRLPHVLEAEPARRAYRLVMDYDLMRVRAYRARPGNPERIETSWFGSALAMRFPAVGYFNQVYGLVEAGRGRMASLRRFFAETDGPWKVHPSPEDESGASVDLLASRGGCSVGSQLFLGAETDTIEAGPAETEIRFEPLRDEDRIRFFTIYLESFGAAREHHEAALRNMTLLPDVAGVYCRVAMVGQRWLGICMLYVRGRDGLLCAGATLPEARGSRVQAALIRHRLETAKELDCEFVASWTDLGTSSSVNLMVAGLRPVLINPVWSMPASGAGRRAGASEDSGNRRRRSCRSSGRGLSC